MARSALRALYVADLRNRLLRLHTQKRLTLRQVAREMNLPLRVVKDVIAMARRDAALERLDLGKEALDIELLRLKMCRRAAGEILLAECSTCAGVAAGCAMCGETGYQHSVAERLQAVDSLQHAIQLEEQIIGPAWRAAAGNWPPMDVPRRFLNALGEITREDLEALYDAHATAMYDQLASRAVLGKPTRYPRLAEKIKEDLNKTFGSLSADADADGDGGGDADAEGDGDANADGAGSGDAGDDGDADLRANADVDANADGGGRGNASADRDAHPGGDDDDAEADDDADVDDDAGDGGTRAGYPGRQGDNPAEASTGRSAARSRPSVRQPYHGSEKGEFNPPSDFTPPL